VQTVPGSGPLVDAAPAALDARVCPKCGTVYPGPANASMPIEVCFHDRLALVKLRDFEASGRDPLLGRTVAGRFIVMSRLGTGSMGAVYRAWQTTVGRWVALKLMRYDKMQEAEARARFEREARAMSQLVSPHTVTVYDFGVAEDGSVFLAMELLEGESLGTRLHRVGRMTPGQAVGIARDALTSLAEAHAKGIIHRDLKPDNLFLTRVPDVAGKPSREICKLLDFGIAKVVREEQAMGVLETQAGTVFGTPRYMSPEQAQGKALDARSDLYSLGVLLYQMVTGVPPFDDEEAVVVMARHIKTKPRPPREVAPDAAIPPQLERVIMRALAKDPGDRPESAEAFIRALDVAERFFSDDIAASSVMTSGHLAAMSADPLPTLAPSAVRRRRWALVIGLGAVVGVVAGVTGVLVRRSPGPEGPPAAMASPQGLATALPVVSSGPSVAAAASSGPTLDADEPPLALSVDELPIAGAVPRTPPRGRGPLLGRPPAAETSPPAEQTVASPPATAATAPPATGAGVPAPTKKYERFE